MLHFANAKLFQPKWSKDIQHEWTSNLLMNRPDIPPQVLARTVQAMNMAFPDAEVKRYSNLVYDLVLPDLKDRHVLAAAIKAGASHIITANTKDFPERSLSAFGVVARHPDVFLMELVELDCKAALMAFEVMVSRLTNPPLSKEQVLATWKKCGLTGVSSLLSSLYNNQ